MSNNTVFYVEDPERLIHIVERDSKGQWFGAENIAMHFSEQSARHIAKMGVLRAMENTLDDHGTWGHYSWIRK